MAIGLGIVRELREAVSRFGATEMTTAAVG
jgi:hypothetical protein